MTMNEKNLKSVKHKEMTVALEQVLRYMEVTDPNMKNVRESTSYNRPDLVDSIRRFGQEEPLWVVKSDDKLNVNGKLLDRYTPLRGFSRREALQTLKDQYPDGVKLEDNTVRKFDAVSVRVIDTSDPMTMIFLKIDQGDRRGLTRVETFLAFEQMHRLGATEKDMAIKLRGSFEANYPPTKKLPDEPNPSKEDGTPKSVAEYEKEVKKYQKAIHEHFKGIIQKFKLIADAPLELREVCLQTLRGERSWPTNDELREGMALYDKEVAEDTTSFLSKENPGPGFMEWFKNLSEKNLDAEKNGKRKAKSTSQMNAAKLEAFKKLVVSPILRRLIDMVQQKIPTTGIVVLDGIMKGFTLTPEQIAILSQMGAAAEKAPETTDSEDTDDAPVNDAPVPEDSKSTTETVPEKATEALPV